MITYPTWGKPENHRLKSAGNGTVGGYASFQEGTKTLPKNN